MIYKTQGSYYIDPTTDYGFKRIFGSEVNKDLLIAFLNGLFRGRKVILDLRYNKNEHVGDTQSDGNVIFDLSCTATNGEQFIIEVQRTHQRHLKRRMLYYASKLIADQAPKGDRKAWAYAISEVYVIALLERFNLPGEEDSPDFLHDVCLCKRESGKIFYEHLGFIYIELTKFVKEEAELASDLDRWLYVLKNMTRMNKLPVYFRKPVFKKLFKIAQYSTLNKEEQEMYNRSLRNKWDLYAIRETQLFEMKEAREQGLAEGETKGREEGRQEGLAEGLAEGRREEAIAIALELKKEGLSTDFIAKTTKLSKEEIENL